MREKARDCCIWFNIVKAFEDSIGVDVRTETPAACSAEPSPNYNLESDIISVCPAGSALPAPLPPVCPGMG